MLDFSKPIEILVGLSTIVASFSAFYKWAYKKGFNKSKEEINNETLKNQYRNIYAPLRVQLLDTHIVTASAIRYPYFKQRFKNAVAFMSGGKIKMAFFSLFDKGKIGPSAGVEYGIFPFSSVRKIVESNSEYADAELVRLVHWAERAKFDNHHQSSDELSKEEFELCNHIINRYNHLSKKFTSV